MKQAQAILSGGETLDYFEVACKVTGKSYVCDDKEGTVLDKLKEGRVRAEVAFIHLSLDDISGKTNNPGEFYRDLFKLLEESTRRVFTCRIFSGQAKGMAIDLYADLVIGEDTIIEEMTREGTSKTLRRIVDKGRVGEEEREKRGKSIELESGQREGNAVAPERKADPRYREYGDQYYRNEKE